MCFSLPCHGVDSSFDVKVGIHSKSPSWTRSIEVTLTSSLTAVLPAPLAWLPSGCELPGSELLSMKESLSCMRLSPSASCEGCETPFGCFAWLEDSPSSVIQGTLGVPVTRYVAWTEFAFRAFCVRWNSYSILWGGGGHLLCLGLV